MFTVFTLGIKRISSQIISYIEKVCLPEYKPIYANLEFKIIKSEINPNVPNSI